MPKLEDLRDAVATIAPLVLTPENAHMKKPWEMIVGGLILPEMVKQDPAVLEIDPSFKDLLEEHTKEKVHKFFHPAPKMIEAKKEVPKIVEKTRVVKVKDGSGASSSGKFRRLKDKVKKVSRFERNLTPNDRDSIIARWNAEQRLVPKEDPICVEMAEVINKNSGLEPIAPLQIAGYFSYLCRLGQTTEATREARIDRAIKRGAMTVRPKFSKELIQEIIDNYNSQRKEEDQRKKDHEELRRRRQQGDMSPIRVETLAPTEAPKPAEPKEEFDLGKISFD